MSKEQTLAITANEHIQVSSLELFFASLHLAECPDFTLPLHKEGRRHAIETIALNPCVALNVVIGRFKVTIQLNKDAKQNNATSASIIDDKRIVATRNMAGLFVEELLEELGIPIEDKEKRHEAMVELLRRVLIVEMMA